METNWYEQNKDYQKANARKHSVQYREAARDYILDVYCDTALRERGESDPRVLEFHHVRGVKEEDISSLIGRGSSLQRLKAEVEKCDVLCANCHRKITVQERGWFKGRK